MDRRTFLQRASFVLPGLAVAGVMATIPRKLFATNTIPGSFSLSLVTDQPERALVQIQAILDQANLPNKNIRYTEYLLTGRHVADIAYTRSGQLIDFRKDDHPLSARLRAVAGRLDMPRTCENPVLAHFSCDESVQKPSGIRIFRDNQLIMEKSFPKRTEAISLDGVNGKVVLELNQNRSVHFAESSCTHKTCMTMGSIKQAGQNLVCIPNQIAVTITGTDISGVDSITF